MGKDVSILWGLVSIKNGADSPTVKDLQLRSGLPTPQSFSINQTGFTFFKNGEDVVYFDINNAANIERAVNECPPISYIVNKMGSSFCNGKIVAVNKNTNNPVQGLNKSYQSIIDRPNYLQNDYSFRMQVFTHVKYYGYNVVLKIKPKGMEKMNVYSSMWSLPNKHIKITWKFGVNPMKMQSIYDCIETITFCDILLEKDDIYIFTDDTPYSNDIVLPESRLTSLKVPINNLIINYTARGKLMNSPMGIFSASARDSAGTNVVLPKHKKELQEDFSRYGMSEGQWKYIISQAAVEWQPMSFPIAQMQFDIMERNDTITIAEGFNYPPFLLGLADKGIYNNVSEAKQALYNEAIIPFGNNYVQQLQECLKSLESGVSYIVDFSSVPCLQADKKYEAETRKIMGEAVIKEFKDGMITHGRAMELMNEEIVKEWEKLYYYELPHIVAEKELQQENMNKKITNETAPQ